MYVLTYSTTDILVLVASLAIRAALPHLATLALILVATASIRRAGRVQPI